LITKVFYMNTMLAGMFGGWELVVIFAAILILFGAKRIPDFAKGLGQGIREFKKAAREVTDEVNMADTTPQKPSAPVQSQPPQTVSQSTSQKA
jgi:sec-independent protein translocase protein TatA